MDKERKEIAERKTRLQEIFEETKALNEFGYISPEQSRDAEDRAREDIRDVVVTAFRRFHQRHTGRVRRKVLLDIFAEAARNMS